MQSYKGKAVLHRIHGHNAILQRQSCPAQNPWTQCNSTKAKLSCTESMDTMQMQFFRGRAVLLHRTHRHSAFLWRQSCPSAWYPWTLQSYKGKAVLHRIHGHSVILQRQSCPSAQNPWTQCNPTKAKLSFCTESMDTVQFYKGKAVLHRTHRHNAVLWR